MDKCDSLVTSAVGSARVCYELIPTLHENTTEIIFASKEFPLLVTSGHTGDVVILCPHQRIEFLGAENSPLS